MQADDLCPYCKKGRLKVVPADEPWNDEYLACPVCDSTFIFETGP
jgi:uncharacterized protein YbaR (Trm112 family)